MVVWIYCKVPKAECEVVASKAFVESKTRGHAHDDIEQINV